ncbi:hypothetical protein BDZ91DRAFT_227269 [Kalaharituber pfeilii]|nr:hypothetical protein BDZ91DRAFT_227269 [Kalaharituber pfeilii]
MAIRAETFPLPQNRYKTQHLINMDQKLRLPPLFIIMHPVMRSLHPHGMQHLRSSQSHQRFLPKSGKSLSLTQMLRRRLLELRKQLPKLQTKLSKLQKKLPKPRRKLLKLRKKLLKPRRKLLKPRRKLLKLRKKLLKARKLFKLHRMSMKIRQ